MKWTALVLLVLACSFSPEGPGVGLDRSADTTNSLSGGGSITNTPVNVWFESGGMFWGMVAAGVLVCLLLWWVVKLIGAIERVDSKGVKREAASRLGGRWSLFGLLVRLVSGVAK